jgi:hypothetical protein
MLGKEGYSFKCRLQKVGSSWMPSNFLPVNGVWLFDCESYLNRKEIIPLSVPESMPVHGTMNCLGGLDFESAGREQNKMWFKQNKKHSTRSFAEHVEPCCMVLCRTKQGRKTGARRQEKHAPDRACFGVFSISPFFLSSPHIDNRLLHVAKL